MDWFSWLSKTGLEPSLVYEYGLSFAHNELEEEDMIYFDHEFLQSMGISIAKHRLEILKLAKKDKGRKRPRAMARIAGAIKNTKRRWANYIRSWTHCEESSSALVVLPTRPTSSGYGVTSWKCSMMKRSKKNKSSKLSMSMSMPKEERLLLTNGSPAILPALDGYYSSPMVYNFHKDGKMDRDADDGYWSAAVEEIRWDTMFQDLKPN